jgi:glutaredoxin-dependent peroxiredoxin
MGLLRDRSAELRALGVEPYGVSRDSAWTHVAWRQALDLDFALLSDWNGQAVRAFGVDQDYRGMREVARRSAFLVDAGGTIRGAWSYGNSELPDLDELVAAARELR